MNSGFIYFLKIADWIIFCLALLGVIYLMVFALASLIKHPRHIKESGKLCRFLVVFPSYKEDNIIISSVKSFLKQEYPSDKYDVTVISDGMKDETVSELRSLPVNVIIAHYQDSSKAKALNLAVEKNREGKYDMIVILDADNIVDCDFLQKINNAAPHFDAIQAHRTGKNRDTATSILDAASEEINNSVFRKGHNNLGLSSALIGSGMAFNFKWFCENVSELSTSGEDKEIEILLLKAKIHICYLYDVYVYDLKTQRSSAFYNQRRRWMATQFYSLSRALKGFLPALLKWNIDYLDKIFQWFLPPRILHVCLILIMAIITSCIDFYTAIKWWMLFVLMITVLFMAIPRKDRDKKLLKASLHIPALAILMFANLFRIKGADKTFIHTNKNI